MAKIVRADQQAMSEVKDYFIDFTESLPTGATVSSATATHTPPSGSASSPAVAVASPVVTVTFGPLSVTGDHRVDILATLSDGEKPLVRLWVPVHF